MVSKLGFGIGSTVCTGRIHVVCIMFSESVIIANKKQYLHNIIATIFVSAISLSQQHFNSSLMIRLLTFVVC